MPGMPKGLVAHHGSGLWAHGTDTKTAGKIIRGGAKGSEQGNLGAGVYTTDSAHAANFFGAGNRHGVARPGQRPGKMLVFKPKNAPQKQQAFAGQNREAVFSPKELGRPVHVQNVKHSTVRRSMARERGEAPLPKTGFRQPAPTPVSQLSRSDIAARRQAIERRRNPLARTTGKPFI
jgi:hypothetical protein